MGIGTLRRRYKRAAPEQEQADTSPAEDPAGEAPSGDGDAEQDAPEADSPQDEPQQGQERPEEPEAGQEPTDVPADADGPAERPAGNASRDEWAAYAATLGLEQEQIDGASRDELRELTAADG